MKSTFKWIMPQNSIPGVPRSGSHTIEDLANYDLLIRLSFLKFYVMRSPGIDLYGILHVKVDFIAVLEILGRFVRTTWSVQCEGIKNTQNFVNVVYECPLSVCGSSHYGLCHSH